MTPVDEQRLQQAIDRQEIRELQAAYGDAVTRRAWDELVPMFKPDCPITLDLRDGRTIEHVGPEAIGAFIAQSIERFEYFEFALLNAVVDVDVSRERATGRLYMWELRQQDGRWSNAYGLYRDRYERSADDRWVFAERRYSSLARTALDGSSEVFPIPPL